MVYKPGQKRGPDFAENRVSVLLEDGLSAEEQHKVVEAVRAHEDVAQADFMRPNARAGEFGRKVIFVTTKPGADDQAVATSLQNIKGVKAAERQAMRYPMRGKRPGPKL